MEVAYAEALQSIQGNPCPRQTMVPLNRMEARNGDLLACLPALFQPGPLDALRGELRELTGCPDIVFAPSGRCALAQILSRLPQKEVVMPAFTCDVVKSAVEVAGKRIVYVDLAKHSVNATSAEYAAAAEPGRVLLVTHLFGIATDVEAICALARERQCVVIEDAAGAFGCRRDGRVLGTFGDFGVYSFERSKRISAFRGGAVLVNNPRLLSPSQLETARVVKTEVERPLREILRALVYNTVTVPWIYGRWVAPRLVQRYRNAPLLKEIRREDAVLEPCYTREFHPYQAALALRGIRDFGRMRERIASLVEVYREGLQNTRVMPLVPTEADPGGLLRYPVVVQGQARAEVLRQALRRGLYLETNFERPLAPAAEYSARYPNALWARQHLVLLPLYSALEPSRAVVLARKLVEIASCPKSG